MSERIQYVDENDQPIGAGSNDNAWAKGIHHRLVRVILRDETGMILSQLRSPAKKSYPNRWTDSATGHVDEGEDYEQAVHREMYEEIGVKTTLTFLGKFLLTGHQDGVAVPVFNGVFDGTISRQTPLTMSKDEVADVQWIDIQDLKQSMKDNPDLYTPGFIETIRRFY
ncbi:MAG: idi [Candidatus Saccharibacteria bacterium]|nr:idi [Candidatus Saccharibacteria bacterium]